MAALYLYSQPITSLTDAVDIYCGSLTSIDDGLGFGETQNVEIAGLDINLLVAVIIGGVVSGYILYKLGWI